MGRDRSQRRRPVLLRPPAYEADRREVTPESADALRVEVRVVGGGHDGDVTSASLATGNGPLLLRVEEAALMLAISRTTLYPLLGRDIPIVRIGRSVRIPADALRHFIADHVDRQ